MDRLFEQDRPIVISTLTRIELASSLQRLLTVDKAIDHSQFHDIWASFSLDLAQERLSVVGIGSETVEGALHLLYDAYATPVDALLVSTAISLGSGVVVVSSDQKMNRMLEAAGLMVIDPAWPPATD